MALTRDEVELVDKQSELLNDAERGVITETFNAIYEAARIRGVKVARDDRAAKLEASLISFLIQSR